MTSALETLILEILKLEDFRSKGLIIECAEERCSQEGRVPLFSKKLRTSTTRRWSIRPARSQTAWMLDGLMSLLGSLLASALWWLVIKQ